MFIHVPSFRLKFIGFVIAITSWKFSVHHQFQNHWLLSFLFIIYAIISIYAVGGVNRGTSLGEVVTVPSGPDLFGWATTLANF